MLITGRGKEGRKAYSALVFEPYRMWRLARGRAARVFFFSHIFLLVRLSIHILYLINRLLTRVDTAPVLKSKDAPLKEEKTHACHHMHIHSGRLSEVRFRGYLVAGAFVASMA